MKACPRVTPEERKSICFTEEELDSYEGDRQNNVCDDIEVVAVEFSDSDETSANLIIKMKCDSKIKSSVLYV